MTIAEYKEKIVWLVDAYLSGKMSRDSVWQWAQEAIVSKEWGQLPRDVEDAIHGLWLLHDKQGDWVPGVEELQRIRDSVAT